MSRIDRPPTVDRELDENAFYSDVLRMLVAAKANTRDRPFRDLLTLLTTAIKPSELPDIAETQRNVLRQAFADLPKLFLDDDLVERHIDRFAEHGVDEVVSPIRATKGKRIKVTIEEID